jgi:hypothetical protein
VHSRNQLKTNKPVRLIHLLLQLLLVNLKDSEETTHVSEAETKCKENVNLHNKSCEDFSAPVASDE